MSNSIELYEAKGGLFVKPFTVSCPVCQKKVEVCHKESILSGMYFITFVECADCWGDYLSFDIDNLTATAILKEAQDFFINNYIINVGSFVILKRVPTLFKTLDWLKDLKDHLASRDKVFVLTTGNQLNDLTYYYTIDYRYQYISELRTDLQLMYWNSRVGTAPTTMTDLNKVLEHLSFVTQKEPKQLLNI